jgi:phospholipase D
MTSRKNEVVKFFGISFFIIMLAIFVVNEMRTSVETYICQKEDCREILVGLIDGAEKEVKFMAYSLTDDSVGDALVRASGRGVLVMGVMEKQQKSQYSEFDKLFSGGVGVSWDDNSALMHHKVFVIDGKIVVTGSCNPTENGFENNDENIVVIHNRNSAEEFLQEFERVRG